MAGAPVSDYGGGVVYASENVSNPALGGPGGQSSGGSGRASAVGTLCQTVTAGMMAKVGEMLRGFAQGSWLPWTAADQGSRYLGPEPRLAPYESPYDLDAGEHITRFGAFPAIDRPFPYPWTTGAVSGFLPLQDVYSRQWSWGKQAFGPSVGTPMQVPWQITYPGLQKVTG